MRRHHEMTFALGFSPCTQKQQRSFRIEKCSTCREWVLPRFALVQCARVGMDARWECNDRATVTRQTSKTKFAKNQLAQRDGYAELAVFFGTAVSAPLTSGIGSLHLAHSFFSGFGKKGWLIVFGSHVRVLVQDCSRVGRAPAHVLGTSPCHKLGSAEFSCAFLSFVSLSLCAAYGAVKSVRTLRNESGYDYVASGLHSKAARVSGTRDTSFLFRQKSLHVVFS